MASAIAQSVTTAGSLQAGGCRERAARIMANHPLVRNQKEEYDVHIGRPSEWGNPFIIGAHGTRREVIALHRKWVDGLIPGPNGEKPPTKKYIREQLQGKRLGCFCKPKSCHGDYLAHVANPPKRGLFF